MLDTQTPSQLVIDVFGLKPHSASKSEHQNVSAAQPRATFRAATQQIEGIIAATLPCSNPEQVTRYPPFSEMTHSAWIFLLMAHELDHRCQSCGIWRAPHIPVS
jgi:cell division septation protein DedD